MWLPTPCLAAVTSLDACGGDANLLVARVVRAVEGGVGLVQVREKGMASGRLLTLAERLRAVTRGRALLFINDRADVALAVEADGVQLGEESLPIAAARRVVGTRLRIGRSVHSLEAAVEAERLGADLLVVGTIFPSASHPGEAASGPALLTRVRARVSVPVLAIGGVTEANAGQVAAAGADGAAVITALLGASDPAEAARRLLAALHAKAPRSVETPG